MAGTTLGAVGVFFWLEIVLNILLAVALIVMAETLARRVDQGARRSSDSEPRRAEGQTKSAIRVEPVRL
jgi:membrane protein implicated in regulation of membrane protease activity